MKSVKSLLSVGGTAALIFTSAVLATSAQARTLSYASVYPAGSEADVAVREWAEKLEEHSNGELKWVGLVQGVQTPDELTDIYYNEIFAKVDVSKHGL